MIEYNIRINLQGDREQYSDIILTTGDKQGYRLNFAFYSYGVRLDVSSFAMTVKARRSDGQVILDSGITGAEGAYYVVADNVCNIAGPVAFEVALVSTEGSLATTHVVHAYVREGFGEKGLAPEDVNPILAKAAMAVESAMTATENANEAEAVRVAAELQRSEAEAKRQAGYEEMNNTFSNALIGKESGFSLHLDDVSPVEHDYKVSVQKKNLCKPYEYTFVSEDGGLTLEFRDNTLMLNGSSEFEVGVYIDQNTEFTTLEPGTYTVSVRNIRGDCWELNHINIRLKQPDDTTITGWMPGIQDVYNDMTRTFTITEETEVAFHFSFVGTFENFWYQVQIEKGTSATPYAPYVESLEGVTLVQNGKNLSKNVVNQATTGSLTGRVENNLLTVNGTGSKNIANAVTNDENLCFYLHPGTYIFSLQYVDGNCSSIGGDAFYVGVKQRQTGATIAFTGIKVDNVSSNKTKTFTIFSPTWVYVYFVGYGSFYNLQYHIQVEAGSAMTPYEEYTETRYAVNEDGTVDDVTLYHPYTSLIPDTAGAIVSCEYNKDANKVIEKLTNAIISLGGNM